MQGLLPRLQASLQQEIDRAAQAIDRCCSPLEKFQVCFWQSTSFCGGLPVLSIPSREGAPSAGSSNSQRDKPGSFLWAAVSGPDYLPATDLHTHRSVLASQQQMHGTCLQGLSLQEQPA